MAEASPEAAAGGISRAIVELVMASARSTETVAEVDAALLCYVAETVAAYVEEGEVVTQVEARGIFQDAGLGEGEGGAIDESDLQDICATIEVLTRGEPPEDEDEDEEVDDGSCEMCERFVKRTFHHLVPKETHGRFLKRKALPANPGCDVAPNAECTRLWLNRYGAKVCRACHWAIHQAEPNQTLAEEYNTLQRLLSHPKIFAFAKYNSKRKARQKL